MYIIKFYFLIFIFLFFNVNANESVCVNLKKEISKSIESAELYVSDTVDLDKTFSKITKTESSVFNSNVNIDNGKHILPFFTTKNEIISVSSFNGVSYSYKSPELTITGGLDEYIESSILDNASNNEDHYPQDLLRYDGFKEAYDRMTNYQLYINMFSTKYSEIDCNKHFNLGAMAHIMSNKLIASFSKMNWYHIKGNDFNMIINYNEIDNSVQIQYYLNESFIELFFYYKKPIDIDAFNSWLSYLKYQK